MNRKLTKIILLSGLCVFAFQTFSEKAIKSKNDSYVLAPKSLLNTSITTFRGDIPSFISEVMNNYLQIQRQGQKTKKISHNSLSFDPDHILFFHSIDPNACHVLFNGIHVRTKNRDGSWAMNKIAGEGKRMKFKGKTNRDFVMETGIKRLIENLLPSIPNELISDLSVDSISKAQKQYSRLFRSFKKNVNKAEVNRYQLLKEFRQLKKLAQLTMVNEEYENVLKTAFEKKMNRQMTRKEVREASRLLLFLLDSIRKDDDFIKDLNQERESWKNIRTVFLHRLRDELFERRSGEIDSNLEMTIEPILLRSRTNAGLRQEMMNHAKMSREMAYKTMLERNKEALKKLFQESKQEKIKFSNEWKRQKIIELWSEELDALARKNFLHTFIFRYDDYLHFAKGVSVKEAPKGVIPLDYDHYTPGGRNDLQPEDKHFQQIRAEMPRFGRVREIEKRWIIIERMENYIESIKKDKSLSEEDKEVKASSIMERIGFQMTQIEHRCQELEQWLNTPLPYDTKNLSQNMDFSKPEIWKESFSQNGEVRPVPRDTAQLTFVPNMKAIRMMKGVQNLDPDNPNHWVEVLSINGKPVTGDWDVFETGFFAENARESIKKKIHDKTRMMKKSKQGIGQRNDRMLFLSVNRAFNMLGMNSPIQHHASQHAELAGLDRIRPSFPLVVLYLNNQDKFVSQEINSEEEYRQFLKNEKVVITENPIISPKFVEKVSKTFDSIKKVIKNLKKAS